MEVETLQQEKVSAENKLREYQNGHKSNGQVQVTPVGLSHSQLTLKRALDLVIIFLASPILVSISIITAILIKLDSKGSVFFTQERVGQKGKPFTMYKFRSMTVDSEKNGSKFAKEDDHRVTKIGKFIRKYRIDEIPQFFNVLKGEMSVIGPRPEQATFVELFNEEIYQYDLRHSVKPGITGLAQVHQGYASTRKGTEMKLSYDLFYIENYSLGLDLLIIWRTIKTICTGFGAR